MEKATEVDLDKFMKVQVVHPQGNAVWFITYGPDGNVQHGGQPHPVPVDAVAIIQRDAAAEQSKKRRHIVEIR